MMVRVNRVLLALCLAGIAMTGSSYDLAPSPYLAVSLPGDGLPHSFPRNCEQRELQGDGHLFPESKLNGARDLRATYGWAHDSRGLILMVDVADDYLETESGPTLWMGDSIKFSWNLTAAGKPRRGQKTWNSDFPRDAMEILRNPIAFEVRIN